MEINYEFTKYFEKIFKEHTGINLDEDTRAQIMANIKNITPHKKIDDKGRYSEYFTFRLNDKLVTIVCDAHTHKIITGILETHYRPQFYSHEDN